MTTGLVLGRVEREAGVAGLLIWLGGFQVHFMKGSQGKGNEGGCLDMKDRLSDGKTDVADNERRTKA